MVGVPFLVSRCEAGPSVADRLALALLQAQRRNDHRPEEEHQQKPGRRRAEGAEGQVAEQVEDARHVRKIGQPGQHRESLTSRRGGRKSLAQRRHHRPHAAAVRSLDHDARRRRAARRRVGRTNVVRPLGPGGAHRRRRGVVRARASAGPRANSRSTPVCARAPRRAPRASRAVAAELQHVADHRDAPPAGARLRRAEQRQRGAHRGRIGVVALVDDGERAARDSASVRACAPPLLRRECGRAPPPRAATSSAERRRDRAARRARSRPYAGPARRGRSRAGGRDARAGRASPALRGDGDEPRVAASGRRRRSRHARAARPRGARRGGRTAARRD